jgi:hypothetical protein
MNSAGTRSRSGCSAAGRERLPLGGGAGLRAVPLTAGPTRGRRRSQRRTRTMAPASRASATSSRSRGRARSADRQCPPPPREEDYDDQPVRVCGELIDSNPAGSRPGRDAERRTERVVTHAGSLRTPLAEPRQRRGCAGSSRDVRERASIEARPIEARRTSKVAV